MASTYELIVKAVDQTSGPLSRIERNLRSLQQQANRVKLDGIVGAKQAAGAGALAGAISKIPGPLVAIGAAAGTAAIGMNAIVDATKEFQRVQNSLKLITNGTEDLANATARLRGIAQETRTSFSATADLYSKLVIASDELGVSTDDVAEVTANLSKALAVAGADGATTSSVIRQFGQAMASGTVRGDEFNSLVEGLGPALSIMAKETGINVGELRRMSQAGELTAKVMFDMLKNSTALNDSFNKMAPTLDSLETAFGDAFDRALVSFGRATGVTEAYERSVKSLTKVLNDLSIFLDKDDKSLASVTERLQQQKDKLAELESMTQKQIGTEIGLTRGLYNHQKAIDAVKEEITRLTPIYEQLSGAQQKTSETTKQVTNSFQPLMDSAEKVAGAFKNVGQLTGIDKAQSDLLQLENALDNYMTAQNAGANAANKHGNTMVILRRAIEATKEEIAKYEQQAKEAADRQTEAAKKAAEAEAQRIKRAAEAAEALRRQTDPLYDLTKAYEEKFERLHKVTQAEYELLYAMQATNGGTDKQKQLLKLLGEEALTLSKQLGLVSEHFGDMVATQASDELAKTKQRLEEINDAIARYKGLEPGKTTQLDADALKARQVALEQNKTSLEKQIQALLGVEEQTKKTTKAKIDHTKAVKETESAYSKFLKPLQESALKSHVMENNLRLLNAQFGPGTSGNPQIYKEGLQALANEGFQPAIDQLIAMEAETYSLGDAIQDVMKKSGNSISQELARGLAQGKVSLNSFKDFFNKILEDILAAIIQKKITDPLINGIMGMIPGAGSGAFSFGTPTVGAPMGGLDFSSITSFLGFANGGVPPIGRASIVGERGPELFVPNTAGRIVPNDQLNMGGGETVVNFNISAIDTQTGVEFLLKNKPQIIGMVTQAQNQRGRQGITA